MLWLSPREFAKLVEEHFPATDSKIRELCESGDIPSTLAKRDRRKKRGPWSIKVKGIFWILKNVLDLPDSEILELKAKSTVTINSSEVA